MSYNSSTTLDHILQSANESTAPVAFLVGDFSYAGSACFCAAKFPAYAQRPSIVLVAHRQHSPCICQMSVVILVLPKQVYLCRQE